MQAKKKTRSTNKIERKVSQRELDLLSIGQSTILAPEHRKSDLKINILILSALVCLILVITTILFINKNRLGRFFPHKSVIAIVINNNTVLRENNGLEFPAISKINKSQMLIVLDSRDYGWIKVKLDDKHVGWVERSNIVF